MGQSRRGKGKKSYAMPLKVHEKTKLMKGKCGNFNPDTWACGFCVSALMPGARGKRGMKPCFKEPGGDAK